MSERRRVQVKVVKVESGRPTIVNESDIEWDPYGDGWPDADDPPNDNQVTPV